MHDAMSVESYTFVESRRAISSGIQGERWRLSLSEELADVYAVAFASMVSTTRSTIVAIMMAELV